MWSKSTYSHNVGHGRIETHKNYKSSGQNNAYIHNTTGDIHKRNN